MKKVKVCLIWMLLSLLRYLFYNKLKRTWNIRTPMKMCRKYVLALLKSALLSKKLSDLIQTINKGPLFFLISSPLWDSRMCVKFVLQSHFCHEIEKEKKGIVCVWPSSFSFVLYWNKTLKSSQSRSRASYAKSRKYKKNFIQ